MSTGWLPISSAPRDGRYIRVRVSQGEDVAAWSVPFGWVSRTSRLSLEHNPVEWQDYVEEPETAHPLIPEPQGGISYGCTRCGAVLETGKEGEAEAWEVFRREGWKRAQDDDGTVHYRCHECFEAHGLMGIGHHFF